MYREEVRIAIAIIILGVALWFVNTKIPMQDWVKTLLNVFVAIVVIIWLLRYFGFY